MITIVTARPCPAETGGGMWAAGETHDVSDSYARALIGRGDAYDTAEEVVDIGVSAQDLADAIDNPAYATQFATEQQTLPIRSIPVSATGQAFLGACAVVGIRAVTLGTGTLTIHDGTAASDATLLRMSRAHGDMTAGTYYPMVSDGDRSALLFDTGVYLTVASGGAYWLDLIDGTEIPGTSGSGVLCVTTRVTASGLAVTGPATIVSVKVIAPGSAGNLDIRGGPVVGSALLHPSTAYTSLAADQLIKLGPAGGGVSVDGLYLTVPTSAVVLVNHLPI